MSLNQKEKEVTRKWDIGSELPYKDPDYLQKEEIILAELVTEGIEWHKTILKR